MKRKHRILIVEDEIVNIEIYRELLEDEFQLLTAMDGESAIELMDGEPPDLVLLDMMLPDINGVELCRRFKSNEVLSHIPIVVVTTLKNQADKIKGLEAGANDYLNKPIDETELLLKVRNHLKSKDLTDQLNDSFQNIVTISNITAGIMSNFDPHYFNFSTNLFNLLNEYTAKIGKREELPTYIMTSTSAEPGGDVLYSSLYEVEG
ncbi:MAG: response regulator, partial [bacterium]|nr:response regulator [bacterium]